MSESKPNAKLRLKVKFAGKLQKLFRLMHTPDSRDVVTPFNRIRHAINELENACDDHNEKLFVLYTARQVKSGLREMYREIQHAAAYARTVVDSLVNYAVDEHSKLLRQERGTVARSLPIPSIHDLLVDIDAIERTFAGWTCTNRSFAVTTHPIILMNDVSGNTFDFGRFSIELALGDSRPGNRGQLVPKYRVRAVTPQLVDGFPHPHVSTSDTLCEGAAQEPLKHALQNGLLYEFFIIIQNTLNNYNSSSPYVPLGAWLHEGDDSDDEYDSYCALCDSGMSDDDSYYCEECNSHVCNGCSTFCEVRGATICDTCIRDATRNNCRNACCSDVGTSGCILHENDPCAVCGDCVSDALFRRCSLVGLNICSACLDAMIADDNPCNVDDFTSTRIRTAMGNCGVCQYIRDDTEAGEQAAGCLLRELDYCYVPEEVDGSIEPIKEEEKGQAAGEKAGAGNDK